VAGGREVRARENATPFALDRSPDRAAGGGELAAAEPLRRAAREIIRELRRFWRPQWIHFRDLSGSEIHLRRGTIELVAESSAAQRAFDRRLRRALEAEENQDARPWEE
jgi:hypothetical protein